MEVTSGSSGSWNRLPSALIVMKMTAEDTEAQVQAWFAMDERRDELGLVCYHWRGAGVLEQR